MTLIAEQRMDVIGAGFRGRAMSATKPDVPRKLRFYFTHIEALDLYYYLRSMDTSGLVNDLPEAAQSYVRQYETAHHIPLTVWPNDLRIRRTPGKEGDE